MKLAIDVSMADINLGGRKDGYWCPIARAFCRAARPHVEEVISVFVGGGTVAYEVYMGSHVVEADSTLPRLAFEFTERFDRGEPVTPILFDVEVAWKEQQDE